MRKRQSALDNRLMQTTLAASGALNAGGPSRELPSGALAMTNFPSISMRRPVMCPEIKVEFGPHRGV
jgi:hypothetical protein